MMAATTDRIEKRITLRATPARVWRALTDAGEFGAWFGVTLTAPFAPGETVYASARYRGTTVSFSMAVERMEPERLLALRWHPFAVDPAIDYTREPTTLVEFALSPSPEGTLLTVTESGFDQIPLERRATAFAMNDAGWAAQVQNIARHVHA
jgi:uncharacterized protein YndB with AHSA1/START domain